MKKKPRPETGEYATAPAAKSATLPGGSDAESFGPWLRRQREGREIDLREIAEASKISLRYLQAFEENRFDLLPADVFAKGFLRQYSKYVGLDAEEVITYFTAARQVSEAQEEDEVTRAIKIRTKNTSRQRTSANRRFALVVLLVAVALLLVVWQLSEWQHREQAPQAAPNEAPATIAENAPDAAPPVSAAGEDPATVDPDGPGAPLVDPAAPPAAGGADPGAPDAALAPGTEPATPTAPAGAEPPPATDPAQALATTAQSGALVRVRLEFQANCWVEASADGKRQLAAIRTQGEAAEFSGDEVVELKLGDYQAAQVEVNGRPLTLAPDNNKTTVVRLRIDLPLVAQLTGVPLETLQQTLQQRRRAGGSGRAGGAGAPPANPR
jgi:cytoskeleton protein RodZ